MHPNLAALVAGIRAIMEARSTEGVVMLEWANTELAKALEGDKSLDSLHESLQPVLMRALSEAGARLSADSLSKIAIALEALGSLVGRTPEGNDVEDAYKALQDAVAQPIAESAPPEPVTPPTPPVETPTPEPVAEPGIIPAGSMQVREAVSILSEAAGGNGTVFRTLVIEAGRSKNAVQYNPDVLRRAALKQRGRAA